MVIRWACILSLSFFVAGCGSNKHNRDGIMSEQLPITVGDIEEIRDGEKNHVKILESYPLYESPKLSTYLNALATSLAEVSDRPNLPYRVILLDDDEVNAFGGPGGYIYLTRGMLNFIESERELAAVMAHEVAHIASREYANLPPHVGKMEKAYNLMVSGTELAKDAVGSYGTAANYALKGMRHVKPRLMRRFSKDEEIEADKRAIRYLIKAGYDPRGMVTFNERISKVDIMEVSKFINFMHVHPPFPARRVLIDKQLKGEEFEEGDLEVSRNMMNEVRQMMVNEPPIVQVENTPVYEEDVNEDSDEKKEKPQKSFVFRPVLGVHPGSPTEMSELSDGSSGKASSANTYSWF